jgi:hypothetical protein
MCQVSVIVRRTADGSLARKFVIVTPRESHRAATDRGGRAAQEAPVFGSTMRIEPCRSPCGRSGPRMPSS